VIITFYPHRFFNLPSLLNFKKINMKKIFLVASLFCLTTAGVNAQTGKKAATSTTVQKKSASATTDTTHHKSMAMGGKKHYKRAKTAKAKS
jgi:hypothetical protein